MITADGQVITVGQVWIDEDDLRWMVVAFNMQSVWVRRYGYPRSRAIQTNPAWFDVWTREA